MKKLKIKEQHIIILFLIGLIVTLAIIDQNRLNKKLQENFKIFNKSNIKGILRKFSGSTSGTYITVGSKEYNYSRKADNFPYIAEKGDSIIKPAFSDTIILKKPNGKIYKFTFFKPNE